jgi:hypothetical protein
MKQDQAEYLKVLYANRFDSRQRRAKNALESFDRILPASPCW